MNVLVDGFVFENTHQKGIRRYMEEILRRVDVSFSVLLDNPAAGQFPESWPVVGPLGPSPSSRFNLTQRWKYREMAKKWRCKIVSHDIYHSSYYRQCPVRGLPNVVVVYDMMFEILPGQFFDLAAGFALEKKVALENAEAVIAISETTRRDVVKIYPELKNKVYVATPGSEHFANTKTLDLVPRVNSNRKPYALFVGARTTYKNFATLLEAMQEPLWPVDLELRVAGAEFNYAEKLAIKFRQLHHRIFDHGRASEVDLQELYDGASVFVFPSIYEGFGIPLLEAQAKGVPVAASDIEIFQEVGGAAFERFQPLDPSSIAGAVARALEPGRSAELRRAGFENIKKFTWAEAARKTLKVWKTVAR